MLTSINEYFTPVIGLFLEAVIDETRDLAVTERSNVSRGSCRAVELETQIRQLVRRVHIVVRLHAKVPTELCYLKQNEKGLKYFKKTQNEKCKILQK